MKTIAWGFAQKSEELSITFTLKIKMYWGLGALDLGPHLGETGRTCPFAPRSARSVAALGVRGPPDVQPRRLQFETPEGLSSGKSVCRAAAGLREV